MFLQNAGVQFLAIACNTAHIYFPSLQTSVNIPLLNMVEIVIRDIPETCRKIALIAARPTVDAGIYQDAIRQTGRNMLEPDWQDDVDALLAATRETTDPAVFQHHWAKLIRQAKDMQADVVMIACLDLSGVLRFAETMLPVVDTAQSLAVALVKQWLEYRDTQSTAQAN